ncbi:protein ARABIDILLO 1-like [Iris pallida]|uniref:Protein ARABIDILLO 1-like n=1 Tax=Iris pallida TaxID=29817 RepID=A0AAX6ID43_IRIPA|nr:protein ARABIDILLO 1-like [Iris pallida]
MPPSTNSSTLEQSVKEISSRIGQYLARAEIATPLTSWMLERQNLLSFGQQVLTRRSRRRLGPQRVANWWLGPGFKGCSGGKARAALEHDVAAQCSPEALPCGVAGDAATALCRRCRLRPTESQSEGKAHAAVTGVD